MRLITYTYEVLVNYIDKMCIIILIILLYNYIMGY